MVPEISVDELDAARAAGALVVDVREPDEFATGRVPGARLLPLGVVPVRAHELPTDQPVYVVCAAGGRSHQAAQYLRRTGVDARSVAGGTGAWVASGRPLETGPAA